MLGLVVSTTIAFCPAILAAPPTVGRVKSELLPTLSLIVPEFRARAVVEAKSRSADVSPAETV